VFEKIKNSSKNTLENMQDIVWAIHPDNDTLEKVILKMKEFVGEICESAGMGYRFELDESIAQIKLNLRIRKDFFLVFKEAVNNAVKYSQGTQLTIRVRRKVPGWIVLEVEDNGRGFTVEEANGGNGIRNMRGRAADINGSLEIRSRLASGTKIELTVPIT
jgi:signal transduction histidine kinase